MAGEKGKNIINFLPSSALKEERQQENRPLQSEMNSPQINEAESARRRKMKWVVTEPSEAAPVIARLPTGAPERLLLPAAPVSVFPQQHYLPPQPGFAFHPPNPTTGQLSTMYRPPASSYTSFLVSSQEQTESIESLLASQAEMLRKAATDDMRRQYVAARMEAEQKLAPILNAKESELNALKLKHQELVRNEAELQSENQAWQRRASFFERRAAVLKVEIQEAAARFGKAELPAECSVVNDGEADEEKEDPPVLRPCKGCGKESDVVLLPCHHLCACRNCAGGMSACPVCGAEKICTMQIQSYRSMS